MSLTIEVVLRTFDLRKLHLHFEGVLIRAKLRNGHSREHRHVVAAFRTHGPRHAEDRSNNLQPIYLQRLEAPVMHQSANTG